MVSVLYGFMPLLAAARALREAAKSVQECASGGLVTMARVLINWPHTCAITLTCDGCFVGVRVFDPGDQREETEKEVAEGAKVGTGTRA